MQPHSSMVRCAIASVAMCTVAISGCAPKAPRAAADAVPVSGGAAYTLIQEPDRTYRPILDFVAAATKSVRMEMYELVSTAAVSALIADQARGVPTKVLLDSAYHGRSTNQRAFNALQAAGVDVRWAPDSVIFHEKAIIVDDTAAVGTANLSSPRYEATSRDAWVIDSAPDDVAAIRSTFDNDFAGGNSVHASAGVAAPRLIWSPDARPEFLKVIAAARTDLSITSEELKDESVASTVAAAAKRGVRCRVVLNEEAGGEAAVTEVEAAGCNVHLLPKSEHGLFMHQKLILADDQMIEGSQNLSKESLLGNRELSLHLAEHDAPQVISAARATFDRDYQQAIPAGE